MVETLFRWLVRVSPARIFRRLKTRTFDAVRGLTARRPPLLSPGRHGRNQSTLPNSHPAAARRNILSGAPCYENVWSIAKWTQPIDRNASRRAIRHTSLG